MTNSLKILFVTPSYKPAFVYGGPTVSVSELAEALVRKGASVTVYTTTANGKAELDVPTATAVDCNGVHVFYFNRLTGDHTHTSPALWRKLSTTVRDYDVVHLQSWWSVLVFGAATICWLKGKQFIVSPRGMLSRYTFETLHTGSKRWLHKIIGAKLLRKSRLHATTLLEWNDCLQVNPEWKGFVLPNLVQFPTEAVAKALRADADVLLFGFLSRIDPKKGLEVLLQALSQVRYPFRLRIAGEGEEEYVNGLKALVSELCLVDKVEWCGWQQGKAKFDFLRSVDVFVLVSHNENFANAVIESLSVGTAVLVSDGVGLADYVQEKNFGWVCKTEPEQLREVLNRLATEQEKLAAIVKNGPGTVRKDYNHDRLASAYSDEYKKLACGKQMSFHSS